MSESVEIKRLICKRMYTLIHIQQGVALTECNYRNGAPRSDGYPTSHAPGGQPARPPAALQTTDTDGRRRQTPASKTTLAH